MKKSLFGYNIKETDNLFNSMQNHIDVLTGKITNLNAELAAKSTVSVDTEEADRKISQLENKIIELEKENAMVKRELTMHSRPEPADSNKKVEYVGKIYLAAYEDAEKIKKNAISDAEEYLKRFVGVKSETKQKFAAALNEIHTQQINMENVLNNSVQKIVEMLRDFNTQSDIMVKKIEVLDADLENNLNSQIQQ